MRTSWSRRCAQGGPFGPLPVFWCPCVQGAGSNSSMFLSAYCSWESKLPSPEQIPGKPSLASVPALTSVPVALSPGTTSHVLPRGSGSPSRVQRRPRETLTKLCSETALSLVRGARNPRPLLNFRLYAVTPTVLPERITLLAHHAGWEFPQLSKWLSSHVSPAFDKCLEHSQVWTQWATCNPLDWSMWGEGRHKMQRQRIIPSLLQSFP